MATDSKLIDGGQRPRRIWPLLVIAMAVLFYFRSLALLQKVPYLSDIRSYYYPLWTFFSHSLKAGSLPLWVPGIYCGFPLFADSEMGLFYPLNLLLLRFPVTAGFNYSIIFHYLLGGWFTYAYCRRLRLSRAASLFAAIPFVLGGFFLSHLVHPNVVATAAWMPLILYCLERALGERRISFFIASGGVLGLQFLCGFLMIPLIEILLGLFYALLYPPREGESRRRSLSFNLGGLALALGLGLGIGMVQNLPSYQLVQNSYRGGGLSASVSNMGNLPPAQMLGLVFPRAFGRGVAMGSYYGAWTFEETYSYIGLLPLLFASVALPRPRRWHTVFFVWLGALSLLLSLGNAGLLWRLLHVLPGFSVLKGSSRFLLPLNLAVALLGAIGFERWRRGDLRERSRRALTRFWIAAAAVVAGTIAVLALLYHFNPLGFRDALATISSPLFSGIRHTSQEILQSLHDYFTSPRIEFLVPLLLLFVFLYLLRKGKKTRAVNGLAALVLFIAIVDVIFFSGFIYSFVPRAKVEHEPAVVDVLRDESGEGRVALLKEPGANRGDFPLCSNMLLPYGIDDAFGFSTIPPTRMDHFLSLLDKHPDIDAFEQLGVTLLYSDLVNIDGLPYELGTPYDISRDPREKRYLLPETAGDELRLIMDGDIMEPNSEGDISIIITGNGDSGATPLVTLCLAKESGEECEVEVITGDARAYMHRVSFLSPGYGKERQALQIRVSFSGIIDAREIVLATKRNGDMQDTRILALDAVDERDNASPLSSLPAIYQDLEYVVYRTYEPRPPAYYAWEPVWAEGWLEAVDAVWSKEHENGRVVLVEGELEGQLKDFLGGLEPSQPGASITVLEEDEDRISLDSTNYSDSILVLSLDYLPGWKACVDGVDALIFSADGFFTAICLPAGEHRVEFSYTPPGLAAGSLVSSICILAFALLFVLARRKESARIESRPRGKTPIPTPDSGSISAFFPCYNDSATLEEVVKDALRVLSDLADDFEIIIVDDGSEDDSGAVAERLSAEHPRLKVIHHPHNRGYGGALRSGISATTKKWVFYTDSDGQYGLEDLHRLWAMSGAADVINGYKKSRSDPWYRVLLGSIYNHCIRRLFAIPIRDVDCDFRLMRGDLVRGLDLTSEGGAICVEMIKGLQAAGAAFAETPVEHYPRQAGKSQFFRLKNLVAMAAGLLSLWWKLAFRESVSTRE
jgi:hypothetical protein